MYNNIDMSTVSVCLYYLLFSGWHFIGLLYIHIIFPRIVVKFAAYVGYPKWQQCL